MWVAWRRKRTKGKNVTRQLFSNAMDNANELACTFHIRSCHLSYFQDYKWIYFHLWRIFFISVCRVRLLSPTFFFFLQFWQCNFLVSHLLNANEMQMRTECRIKITDVYNVGKLIGKFWFHEKEGTMGKGNPSSKIHLVFSSICWHCIEICIQFYANQKLYNRERKKENSFIISVFSMARKAILEFEIGQTENR